MLHITHHPNKPFFDPSDRPATREMTTAHRLRRTTLADDCYAALREIMIDAGRYRPGDKISIEELSRELGVSRSPVWAAVARLGAEGIIEIEPRQGVFLVRFDLAKVRAAFEAREALEGMAARLAADRISAAEFAALESTIKQQKAALAAGDVQGYVSANLAFHQGVLRSARNETIASTLLSIYTRVKAMCGGPQVSLAQLRKNCKDHERLLGALQTRDADRAEREARTHVQRLATVVAANEQLVPSQPRVSRTRR
jgi:DNA-binding GntR family transcriptional regulator